MILDLGFWTKQQRDLARDFFQARKIPFEFHFLQVSPSEWERRIASRNREVSRQNTTAYFVDEGLKQKCEALFEPPQRDEIAVWVEGST